MVDNQLPALSPSETRVLRILWELREGAVQDVCDQLPPERKVAYATVQTLLRRLESKGYITHTSRGKAHIFRPATGREEVVTRTVGDFVDRLFGGDRAGLMLHLADHSGLGAADIERLRKLIAKGRNESGEEL